MDDICLFMPTLIFVISFLHVVFFSAVPHDI